MALGSSATPPAATCDEAQASVKPSTHEPTVNEAEGDPHALIFKAFDLLKVFLSDPDKSLVDTTSHDFIRGMAALREAGFVSRSVQQQ